MKVVPIFVSTSLLLMSAASFAQSQPMTPAKSTPATQDSNSNQSNTSSSQSNMSDKQSAAKQKAASEHYTKLDTNKDGKLSAAEFSATPKGSKDFATLDSDKDGNLTTEEFAKHKMQ